MFDFISKLQEKPLAARRRIAFFTTAVLGLIVIAIWSSTFYQSVVAINSRVPEKKTDTSSFEDIKSNFANVGQAISEGKDSIKNAFNFNQ
jgi:hypothetical protein